MLNAKFEAYIHINLCMIACIPASIIPYAYKEIFACVHVIQYCASTIHETENRRNILVAFLVTHQVQ